MDKTLGDAVISMDCDLQHPPNLIPTLVQHWEAGNEVVATIRQDTKSISTQKQQSSHLFYKFLNLLSDIEIKDGDESDFAFGQKSNCRNSYYERKRAIPERYYSMGWFSANIHSVYRTREILWTNEIYDEENDKLSLSRHYSFQCKTIVHSCIFGVYILSSIIIIHTLCMLCIHQQNRNIWLGLFNYDHRVLWWAKPHHFGNYWHLYR